MINYTFALKPFSVFLSFLLNHANVCMFAFDPIHDVPPGITLPNLPEYRIKRVKEEESFVHRYFLLPILVWTFLAVDTCLIRYQNPEIPYKVNPSYFIHRMYSEAFWQQGNMLVLVVSTGILLTGLTFLLNSWLKDRYCMYFIQEEGTNMPTLIVNGKAWNAENSAKIYRFRKQCRKFVIILGVQSEMVGYLFFAWNFWNSPFQNWAHYLKMFVFLPILTWYCIFTVALLFYHFFVLSKYISMKQSHLLTLQKQLLSKLNSPVRKERRSRLLGQLYSAFHSLNTHLAYQCAEIGGLNHFWAGPLTIMFVMEIIVFCYLLYASIFFKQTIDQFIYFFFYLVELGVFIFLVLFRASVVDHNNDRAYAGNVQSCVLFQLKFNRINERLMLNIEKLATNQSFTRSCFRLRNGYRVDSTAFQMAYYFISTFFIMICRQNRRNIGLAF